MISRKSAEVSVVILTYNEEANLPYALRSVKGWSDDIHVVDSGSTDRTMEIAKEFDVHTYYNPWTNWAVQRNWTLDNCSLRYEWILFLDADEQLTLESRQEIAQRVRSAPEECQGFYVNFHFYFLGKRVRNAMYPHLMLMRNCGHRWYMEGSRDYCSAPIDSPVIKAYVIHEDHRGIKFWSEKFIDRAKMDARSLYRERWKACADIRCDNSEETVSVEKRRFRQRAREVLYSFCPPFVRALLFFAYRLLFKMDIRDGWAGLAYAFFFGLWYPMLVDAMYLELCLSEQRMKDEPKIH